MSFADSSYQQQPAAGSHIVLGLSGGVDSAVAAWRLLQQDYRVTAVFMKNWEEDDTAEYCAAAADLADARRICEALDIPLRTVNFASEYWERVFSHFLAEYRAGRTPNPDILCNKEIKFRAFLEHALTLGATHIATGHYVRTRVTAHGTALLTGSDPNKDQSYFLHSLDQAQLAPALFPLGGLNKPEVRRLARELDLPVHAKKDSTGLCFIGERRFADFLQRFLPAQPGEIVDANGQLHGQHQGLMYYTIGQRQGLGLGGSKQGTGAPWYVAGKALETNRLIVVQGHDHPALFQHTLRCEPPHWINGAPPLPLRCTAKIRYRQTAQPCVVTPAESNAWEVCFDQPQWAITPGQSVVFYAGEQCLGGAVISA